MTNYNAGVHRFAVRCRDGSYKYFEEDNMTDRLVPITAPPDCLRIEPEDDFPGWVKMILWLVLGALSWAVLVTPVYLLYLAW